MTNVQHRFTSKIANKIFFTSVLLVLIVLLVQSFLYIFVIDDAQFFNARNNLENDFEGFIDDIKDKNYDKEYIELATRDYVNDTNNPIIVLDKELELINENTISLFFDIITVTHDNTTYKIAMSENDFESIENDTISIMVSQISENYYFAIFYDENNEEELEDAILLEDAKIIDFEFAESQFNDNFLYIYQGIDFLEKDYKKNSKEKYQSFEYKHIDIDAESIFFISHYSHDGKTYYVLTSDTVIGLKDQLGFITNFNIFIFFLGLILAIIISRIFSKSLSKPMVALKDIANQMAQLDFSKKATITSHDELGSLANSLNQMSDQLNKNILELQKKNEELEINYELKSKEEKRAKDLILHLSHELNTPLGIVSGFNEILSDGINDKEPTYYYEAISYELERMKTLVSDMLELSVLESGDYTLVLEDVKLDTMIQERITHYQDVFDEKDIQVITDVTSEVLSANGRKIHQVINNLISNAAKYTSENGTFKVYSKDEGDDFKICFENTCQLEEENPDILWEKFYRTKKTNTRKEKGSGIGLSIAKEILMLHDSDFGIETTEAGIIIYFKLKKS